MRRIVVCLVVATLSVAMPAGVAADPTSICPDQMYLVPVSAVQNGSAKDKNGNGLVCAKYTDGGFKGGPDDRSAVSDDIVL
jgi:hypothetical protein